MFGKKRDVSKITRERRMSYLLEGKDYRSAEIEYLQDLKDRFDKGKIDEADVAEAFRIIQEEAILMYQVNDLYRVIDNLAKCGKAIMFDGKVSIPEGSLIYIRQKMPVEEFIDANIKRIEESMTVDQAGDG